MANKQEQAALSQEQAARNMATAESDYSINSENHTDTSDRHEDDLSGIDTAGGKTTNSSDSANGGPNKFSQVESQKVFRLRMAVIGVLILTALAVSSAVFKITVQGEVDEFETQYEGAASKVIDSFEDIMIKMESVAGLGVSFTSEGQRLSAEEGGVISESWPFVSLYDFPTRARNVLQLSGALMVGMSPVLRGSLFEAWDEYVDDPDNQVWIDESIAYQEGQGLGNLQSQKSHFGTVTDNRTVDVMHYYGGGTVVPEVPGSNWYLPAWQTCPYVRQGLVNNNHLRYENTTRAIQRVYDTSSAVLGGMMMAPPGSPDSPDPFTALLSSLRSAQANVSTPYLGDPMTDLFIPIFDTFDGAKRRVVGVMAALIHWKSNFRNVLPESAQGIVVVLEYKCGNSTTMVNDSERRRRAEGTATEARDLATTFEIISVESDAPSSTPTSSYWNPAPTSKANEESGTSAPTNAPTKAATQFTSGEQQHAQSMEDEERMDTGEHTPSEEGGSFFTYIIEGSQAHALGLGDLHDPTFDEFVRKGTFSIDTLDDGTISGVPIDQTCSYNLYVYPSQSYYEGYITTAPLTITLVIVAVFIFAIITFLCFNRLVERRQKRILKKATQSSAIISSLFPKNVRDRLLAGGAPEIPRVELGTKSRLKGFMAGNEQDDDAEAAPIADLFPHCTVFFADIAGFTAWSSTREPSQVFVLLQTVYQAFDQLAKRRRVFKVETIGDCYMAVTGLPDPQDSHASIMVRFAYDCVVKMREVTKDLESELGPDTTELSMRVGLHSGPVTAGVLRGDRARFQLFGDTVNTASRMESTGVRGKIQVSEATAAILREHGRDHWLMQRADAVKAKGKGVLKTFWANPKMRNLSQSVVSSDGEEEPSEPSSDGSNALQQAQIRLVDWIVKLMLDDVRKIIVARKIGSQKSNRGPAPSFIPPDSSTCMDEVQDYIHMPKFGDHAKKAHTDDYRRIQIDDDIAQELGEYVAGIAKMYRHNPFHNFEHACHVTMSVNKLIRRIVSPELDEMDEGSYKASENKLAAHLHDYTYGINSDPLAMFAMTFSALIHDVDHRGVSNMQLASEDPVMATKYHKKSIAEQNSLDLAWGLLMEDHFSKLRKYIFVSEEELLRFRQLIVNIVLATDIFDKELNDLRKNRWKRAFSIDKKAEDIHHSNLRATIVLEHIIQASDVSHTMQHWHVYQKWNKCLFMEMHGAFKAGRLAKDPASFWYKGEIGFFDNYIIPLAKKLKDCGVFGVSSDEYLNYALQNRAEWEERGQDIVAMLVEEVSKPKQLKGSVPNP